MAKIKSVRSYETELWADIRSVRGDEDKTLRHMVEKTAADQRHLAMIDAELESVDFTNKVIGSTGQIKTEINPLLVYRDKVSRTITDDLEALQLTARSCYKKRDNDRNPNDQDPMAEYYNH